MRQLTHAGTGKTSVQQMVLSEHVKIWAAFTDHIRHNSRLGVMFSVNCAFEVVPVRCAYLAVRSCGPCRRLGYHEWEPDIFSPIPGPFSSYHTVSMVWRIFASDRCIVMGTSLSQYAT